jgi:predicted enzyme related to lactoylglutathione lyase
VRIFIVALLALVLSSSFAVAEEAASAEKQYYVITMHLDMDENPTEAQQQAMVGHIAHLNELYASGALYMAGPYMEEEVHDGICIVLAGSAEEARAMEERDPSVLAGIMHITGVHQWWAAFDRPNGATFSVEEMMGMAGGGEAAASSAPAPAETAAPAQPVAQTADAMPEMTPGGSNFIEFPSTDLAATQKFYGELFGWTFEAMDANFVFFTGPGELTGAFTTMYKPTTDGPVMYINCDGIAATLQRISASGGKTTLESMELPMGMGYIGQFTDPSGNVLGLWSSAA